MPSFTPPPAAHWWTLDFELVEDAAGGWTVQFPTGRGWGRCSCGLRIEGPGGESLPTPNVVATMSHHLEDVGATVPRPGVSVLSSNSTCDEMVNDSR